MEDTRIKLNEQDVAYKKGLKWHMLSYLDIKQAYLRIEEARGKLCCGVALFETYYLMLKTVEEELIKIEVSSKENAKRMLDFLKEKNTEIEIGLKK